MNKSHIEGIPNLYWYGVENNYRALVMDNLGPNLEQLLTFCKGKFTLKCVLMIVDQILDRLKFIHQKQFIYNDIEPTNFLVGLNEKADKIFITDFGSCKKYVDSEGNHVQFGDRTQPYHYNLNFVSINVHIGKKLSRRDDLQSLGYMLVYFLKGSLPWLTSQDFEDKQLLIKQKKVSIPLHLLCQDLPKQFIDYFEYVKNLQFEEQPDYTWIKRLFKDLFQTHNLKNNLVFDWASKHQY